MWFDVQFSHILFVLQNFPHWILFFGRPIEKFAPSHIFVFNLLGSREKKEKKNCFKQEWMRKTEWKIKTNHRIFGSITETAKWGAGRSAKAGKDYVPRICPLPTFRTPPSIMPIFSCQIWAIFLVSPGLTSAHPAPLLSLLFHVLACPVQFCSDWPNNRLRILNTPLLNK